MPYQYCHQCIIIWVFLAALIVSCVVAIFHANRGNPDKAIWPISLFKWLTYTRIAHAIENKTRRDLKKYSWRERFLAAWFVWIPIIAVVFSKVIDLLAMVGVIKPI